MSAIMVEVTISTFSRGLSFVILLVLECGNGDGTTLFQQHNHPIYSIDLFSLNTFYRACFVRAAILE